MDQGTFSGSCRKAAGSIFKPRCPVLPLLRQPVKTVEAAMPLDTLAEALSRPPWSESGAFSGSAAASWAQNRAKSYTTLPVR